MRTYKEHILEENHVFVVIAYKQSPFLEDCLCSLKEQDVSSPIIVATSTPSAWLEEIVDRYSVELTINPICNGIASDWNFALSQAGDGFVTLIHQDDVYGKGFSATVRKAIRKHPDSVILFTNYADLVGDKILRRTINLVIKRCLLWLYYIFGSIRSQWLKNATLSLGNPICCPSVTYNRAIMPDFLFNSSYSVNLDWDAWLRLAKLPGRFTYIPTLQMYHRIHDSSETSSGIIESRRQNEDLCIFQRLWPRSIAWALHRLYAASYHSNIVKSS